MSLPHMVGREMWKRRRFGFSPSTSGRQACGPFSTPAGKVWVSCFSYHFWCQVVTSHAFFTQSRGGIRLRWIYSVFAWRFSELFDHEWQCGQPLGEPHGQLGRFEPDLSGGRALQCASFRVASEHSREFHGQFQFNFLRLAHGI